MKQSKQERRRLSERRHQAFRQMLGLFPASSCVDLGTGHGSFARDAARLGWTVTAVDARSDRMPSDPRIDWVQFDIRDFDLTPFSLILCLGLFYHLTLADQIDLISRASGRPMILDTHIDRGNSSHELSERVQLDGYEGSLYEEPGKLTSSWMNDASFWPTLDSFHQMLEVGGYSTVLTLEPWVLPDRTFFLALPDA